MVDSGMLAFYCPFFIMHIQLIPKLMPSFKILKQNQIAI